MTDEELEAWKSKRIVAHFAAVKAMTPQCRGDYLHDLVEYIIRFAGDAGATDWPKDLHLGDVIDKYIRRSPTLMDAADGISVK